MTAELLSVVMPVYNGVAYVHEAIDSVLRQTWGTFEFLIMDDGSTDDTPVILKRYAAQDGRIRLFLRQRQGQIACRNELLQLAKADVVACADADDVCLRDRFEHQFGAITRSSDLWVLGTAIISINDKGSRRRRWRMTTGSATVGAELERRCCIAHPSCMMRRRNILGIGGYRPAYECAEDYDLFLRASEHGKVDNLDVVGVHYRQHEENVSHRHGLRQAISADLARATHLLRRTGNPDPTEGLVGPPVLEDPMLAALIPPAQMRLHRAMAITLDPNADAERIEQASEYFLRTRIGKKQALASQRAMVRLIRRRGWDSLSLRVAARAVALGPGRLIRFLLSGWLRRQSQPQTIARFTNSF
jgi:hypothetical protein